MWTGIFTGIFLFFALSIALLSRTMRTAMEVSDNSLEMPDTPASQKDDDMPSNAESTAIADMDQSMLTYAYLSDSDVR